MKFGQYELRELIAVGGMAEVYKGRVVGAEGFEKHVAIKRILPDLAEDERFVKMLLTEARIHSALSHRNIVQIHDLGISEDGEYFIVLEYVEGYDLRMVLDQLTEQGRILPEALSLHIASELAQGLHFAHEQRGADRQPLGLVHRDVSPSNVLISMSGEIKLSDFGLAKRRHDRSVVGSLKGNLAYMSPEQARQSRLDRRTDVFSLGAVLFEMLTGKRLREIRDEIAAWNHVASGQVPLLRAVRPDLSEPLERLLARALAPEPEGRFADAAIFGSAIRGVLSSLNTPVGATDLQHLLSTLQPARRPRALVPERSKVIRLGPEAQALGEAIAAPLTPLPAPAPGMTSSVSRPPGGITNLAGVDLEVDVHGIGAAPGNGVGDSDMPTPPPVEPLAPVRGTSRAPLPTARADRMTPPRSLQTAYVDRAPARLHSAASAAAAPFASSTWGGAAAAAAVPVAVEGRPATAEHLPTIPSSSTSSQSLPAAARPRRDTARVVVRGGTAWRPLVVAFAATLLLVAGAVHLAVVPLDVLVVWRRPATLAITTDPQGATAELDGTMLPARTPTQTIVRRDRFDHVLELSAPGHRTVRQTLRYDGAVSLSVSARLEKDAGPTFEALPAAPPPAPAPREAHVGAEPPSVGAEPPNVGAEPPSSGAKTPNVGAKTAAPAALAAKPSKAAKGGARRQKTARSKRAARAHSHD